MGLELGMIWTTSSVFILLIYVHRPNFKANHVNGRDDDVRM